MAWDLTRARGATSTVLEFLQKYAGDSVRALLEKYNMEPAYLDGPAFKARMARVASDMKPVIEQLGLAKKE